MLSPFFVRTSGLTMSYVHFPCTPQFPQVHGMGVGDVNVTCTSTHPKQVDITPAQIRLLPICQDFAKETTAHELEKPTKKRSSSTSKHIGKIEPNCNCHKNIQSPGKHNSTKIEPFRKCYKGSSRARITIKWVNSTASFNLFFFFPSACTPRCCPALTFLAQNQPGF